MYIYILNDKIINLIHICVLDVYIILELKEIKIFFIYIYKVQIFIFYLISQNQNHYP